MNNGMFTTSQRCSDFAKPSTVVFVSCPGQAASLLLRAFHACAFRSLWHAAYCLSLFSCSSYGVRHLARRCAWRISCFLRYRATGVCVPVKTALRLGLEIFEHIVEPAGPTGPQRLEFLDSPFECPSFLGYVHLFVPIGYLRLLSLWSFVLHRGVKGVAHQPGPRRCPSPSQVLQRLAKTKPPGFASFCSCADAQGMWHVEGAVRVDLSAGNRTSIFTKAGI